MIPVNRLRELRENIKLTQAQIAKLMDISPTLVSMHESGERHLTPENIAKYSDIYKIQSYEIFMSPSSVTSEADKAIA